MIGGTVDLSVVIVNYNSGARLAGSLERLRALRGIAEVVVVDNGSTDGSAAGAGGGGGGGSGSGNGVRRVDCGENSGFARAANRGVAETRGDLVLLLNPDMLLTGDGLARLVERLRADDRLGAVGPRIREAAGVDQSGLLPFPSNGRLLREALFLPGARAAAGGNGAATGWLQAGCLLLRRAAFEEVGGFDEGFFLYYEDVDLFWRLHGAGWRVAIEPAAEAIHDAGERDARYGAEKIRHLHEGLLGFYRKHYPGERRRSLRRILIIRSLIRLGVWGILWTVAPDRRNARAGRLRGYATVLRTLWGGDGNGSDEPRPR